MSVPAMRVDLAGALFVRTAGESYIAVRYQSF